MREFRDLLPAGDGAANVPSIGRNEFDRGPLRWLSRQFGEEDVASQGTSYAFKQGESSVDHLAIPALGHRGCIHGNLAETFYPSLAHKAFPGHFHSATYTFCAASLIATQVTSVRAKGRVPAGGVTLVTSPPHKTFLSCQCFLSS
jgi:hypothetical protein